MKLVKILSIMALAATAICPGIISRAIAADENTMSNSTRSGSPNAQVPTWSPQDLDFFLHGSITTEMIPERVLRAFVRAYPDLYSSADFSNFGFIPDPAFGWPVGFSRRVVPHLGGLPSVGINCASCHVGEITTAPGTPPLRVLGVTSHLDVEAFFGAVIVAGFRTTDPANMKKFLAAYLSAGDSAGAAGAEDLLAKIWQQQEQKIAAAMTADPFGTNGVAPGALHEIAGSDLRLDQKSLADGQDLVPLVRTTLKLFHNMRAALHVPDLPPDKAPPASGPGRNDAFGLLSAALFGAPQPYGPVKFGLVWNVDQRHWVHWDGNTRSPIGRNLLAALGLGAPLLGHHAQLDFAAVKRQTDLSEYIRPPRYPLAIDQAAAKRGAAHYEARCAACHAGKETDHRLYSTGDTGTDPTRAQAFTQLQADRFNQFLGSIETPGYKPSNEPGIRGTQKYWAASLDGVWARSPYLHNGSVRTMEQLLTPPAVRAKTFQRGSQVFDAAEMGYTDAGVYRFDTTTPGNSNAGHDYGTDLTSGQKHELMEYLKTL